jgi:ABC-2 type transport system ATP-binding protein
MTSQIEARGLKKTYPGPAVALDRLSFSVPEGTIFGLLGPNGAGKSTAVKVLTTLSRPDSGSATVAGVDVLGDPQRVRRTIGVVGQSSGVDPQATGRENLELQGKIHGIRRRALRRRVIDLLQRFELADVADRIARGYSGGMKRRLDIATGLIHRPRVLFLDEPTTGLDPEVRAAMWEEIRDVQRCEGLTILLTTHYMEEAEQLAQRLAIVDRGRVVVEGTSDRLKSELEGDTVEIGIGDPDMRSRAEDSLRGVRGVREVRAQDGGIEAQVVDGGTALPEILSALGSDRVQVATATISRPSLDDVYLRYAGRRIHEAEAGERQNERSDR